MKKEKLPVILLLPVLAGLLMTTQVSYAACSNETVRVKINPHGIWVKPDGGPKCMNVPDPAAVNFEFPIKLNTPGYSLRDGQVHVRQAAMKEVGGVGIGCSDNLEFEEPEYTNTGEDDIVVTVVTADGKSSSIGDFICYDIIVDDVGTIDPRAEVEDLTIFRLNLAKEIGELRAAYNLLVNSGLGDSLTGVSLEGFIEESYGLTEEETHQLIKEYRE